MYDFKGCLLVENSEYSRFSNILPITIVQKEIPQWAEDMINVHVLYKSSEGTHGRYFWLNADHSLLVIPPMATIDIQYEKKGNEYKMPRITVERDTYIILSVSGLSPNDILLQFPIYQGAITKVSSVFNGTNYRIQTEGLINRLLILRTKGKIKLASKVYEVMATDKVFIRGPKLVLNRIKNKIIFSGETDELLINDQRISKNIWETIPTAYKAGIFTAVMGVVIGFIFGRLKQRGKT